MAKKKEENNEPIISSIPVPPSDSALVIDLPDGQKLLVGKIETGTVIEVATWRGTGRPDSRTNRLMLGMSNENDAKQNSDEVKASLEANKKMNFQQKFLFIAKQYLRLVIVQFVKFIKVLKTFDLSMLKKLGKPKNRIRKAKENPIADVQSSLKVDDDFDVDFQRILDEVSQRRNGQSKSVAKSSGTASQNQSPKPKSSAKKATPKRNKAR